jgi:hypothetical protein
LRRRNDVENKGDKSVASPFGLCSGLRQSGGRCALGLDAGLKPRSNPNGNSKDNGNSKTTATAKLKQGFAAALGRAVGAARSV